MQNAVAVNSGTSALLLMMKAACDGGEVKGCHNLAVMLDHGEGGERDKAEARRLYRQACEGGHMKGCANYAVMLHRGEAGARSRAEARRLYGLSCEAGVEEACFNLELLANGGSGTDLRMPPR